ncbi:histidine kinase [Brevibacillus daliensis]|uniref:histidine kinase n=1 Tax=Brevibacillus daliensis TaxID=2892995 RepID=UPI001E2D5218|nr:histidine kinase [Brevibacillus daliensis]
MQKTDKLIANKVYARYSGVLSLSKFSLLLFDINGDILLEFNPSPDFCKLICWENQSRPCADYVNRFHSFERGRFVCCYGMENILLPIMVKDEVVGYVAGMQAYSQESEFQKYLINTAELAELKGLDLELVAKAISALQTIDKDKADIHEQLCNHIARNIALDIAESTQDNERIINRLSVEKEILEKKVIDLEAKNMSLVINPHFLFNTLNSIARIAYFEHSHTTEELIYCLSDLLRYNLKQEDQLHTIASEMDNIEKYLYIQKARFKNRLQYEISIPDDIMAYRIPNMVIQPIVENAVIHGITPKRDGGTIRLIAEKYGNDITISVMDNGNGFSPEVLKLIHQPDSKTGVGFRSTDSRLKRYYGEEYGLSIVKSDYSGSTVNIRITTQPNVR